MALVKKEVLKKDEPHKLFEGTKSRKLLNKSLKLLQLTLGQKNQKYFGYGKIKRTISNGYELLDLSSHTIDENIRTWSEYDWSKRGEDNLKLVIVL